jgi:hypothetical protein
MVPECVWRYQPFSFANLLSVPILPVPSLLSIWPSLLAFLFAVLPLVVLKIVSFDLFRPLL